MENKKNSLDFRRYLPDIISYVFLFGSVLINRFWMLGDLAFSLFRGVPNFYSWIVLWNCHVLSSFGFSGYWAGNAMVPYNSAVAFSENMIGLTPIAFPVHLITDNPVLFVNLLSLILVFITMIILFNVLKRWTGSRLSSLVGTLIFALYPWSMKEFSLGRFHMLAVSFIPLIIYFNVKFWKTGNRKNLYYIFLFFLWTFLSNIYIGIFFTLFIGLLNLIWIFYEKELFTLKKIILWSLSIFIVWIIMIPIFLKYKTAGENLGMIRTLQDQVNYTGPINSWLTVPDENLIYGKILDIFPRGSRDGIVENYMFPGIIASIFFVLSFFYNKFPKWLRSLRLTGIFMVIISMGPYFQGFNAKIPLPFSVFWYVYPPLQATRNPHRFAIFAIFSLAVLAAFMIKDFIAKGKRRTILVFIILILIIAETQSVEKSSIAIEKYSKEFYRKMDRGSGEHIVAELPFEIHTDLRAMAYSTYFWHKTVNGVSGLRPPVQTQLERELKNFPSEHTIRLLQALGVDRVVLNEKSYGLSRKKIIKSMRNFNQLGFLFRTGVKSAWMLKKGRKFSYLDVKNDMKLELKKDKDNISMYQLSIGIPKGGIVFNPRAPSKFKFTLSRNWEITVMAKKDGKHRILKRLKWNPPALFYRGNNVKKIPVENYNEDEVIFMKLDLPGESLTFKPVNYIGISDR